MRDDQLRTALRELADVPPPADPATAALHRAGRDRRRRTTGALGAVGLIAAAAVLVPAVLGRDAPAPTAAPTPTGVYVVAYRQEVPMVGDVGDLPATWPYDPETGTYRYGTPSGLLVDPAPDGRSWLVAVLEGYAVLASDRLGGDNAMPPVLRAGDEPPTWSPDGRRLLWWPPAAGGLTSVRITVAGTDRTTTLTLTGLDELAGPVTRVRWRPGGGLVLLGPDQVLGYTDPAGKVTRTASLLASELRLSPDERYGIADARRVVTLDTGRSVWRAPTGATILTWAGPGQVVVGQVVGPQRERVDVVEVVTGRTVRSTTVPTDRAWVLPYQGQPPAGAIVV